MQVCEEACGRLTAQMQGMSRRAYTVWKVMADRMSFSRLSRYTYFRGLWPVHGSYAELRYGYQGVRLS